MKQNKTILTFIEKEFNKINIKYDILQLRKRKGNKFYRGYIYIYDMIDLTDEQNQYINDNIYNTLIQNGWEILFTDFDTRSYEQIKEESFPLVETD